MEKIGSKILKQFSRKPHCVNSCADYKHMEEDREEMLYIGKVPMYIMQDVTGVRLFGCAGIHDIEIRYDGVTKLKGSNDAHSFTIQVSFGKSKKSMMVSDVGLDAGFDIYGVSHIRELIGNMMLEVTKSELEEYI